MKWSSNCRIIWIDSRVNSNIIHLSIDQWYTVKYCAHMILGLDKMSPNDDVVNSFDNFSDLSIYFIDLHCVFVWRAYTMRTTIVYQYSVWQNIHFNWFFVRLDYRYCITIQIRDHTHTYTKQEQQWQQDCCCYWWLWLSSSFVHS